MAEARQRSEWDRTAASLALLANVNRDPKKRRRPYTPADFHPCIKRRRRPRPVTVDRLADDVMRVAEQRSR